MDANTVRLPAAARRAAGPYAVFECFQSIPCNPCYTFCKRQAVKPLININELPEVDYARCNGCGLCVPHCPGLAIFVIDESFAADTALVKIPYEYRPLPEEGATVKACDRQGAYVCEARVQKVQQFKNRTALVSLAVPKDQAQVVRGIQLALTAGNGDFPAVAEDGCPGESIVCRCEDISQEELQAILDAHNLTLREIKLRSRSGMGPCQGRTCTPLILQEISRRTQTPINQLRAIGQRLPTKPVKLQVLAGTGEEQAAAQGEK